MGYMGSIDDLDRVHKKFNKYMPSGNHETLFDYDHKYDYDYRNDPCIQKSNSVAVLETPSSLKQMGKALKQHRHLK